MTPSNLSEKELRRYRRHLMIPEIGPEGQEKIRDSKVLVVGAGGLGCPILQYLAAAGVGTLGIMDNDKVDESNLQRQLLYGINDIGKLKAIIARQRLLELNNLPDYRVLNILLNKKNALEIIPEYDIVVVATDNFSSRYLINDACVILGKPFVYGSIYKFEGQVSVFNYKNGPSLRCLNPSPPLENEAPQPSDVGVIGVLPGIVGSMQANEVIKMILGKGDILSGKLMIIDIFNHRNYTIRIKANPKNFNIKELQENY